MLWLFGNKSRFMRILLVEDEPHLGSAVQEHVRQTGHAVDWVQRPDAADGAIRAVAYNALLLDLHLPDGRGLDFLRTLRRRLDELAVVILTARRYRLHLHPLPAPQAPPRRGTVHLTITNRYYGVVAVGFAIALN
jgi:CheY-like chemotaxis protein